MARTRLAGAALLGAALALTAGVAASAPWPTPGADVGSISAFGARGANGRPGVSGAGLTVRGPLHRIPPAWRAGSDAMNWQVTLIELDEESGPGLAMANAGLEWQWHARPLGLGTRLRFGFGPALLSEPRLSGEHLGGHFQFTSHLALALAPGRDGRWAITTGFYHVSNGSIHERNPGFEIQTLELRARFRF